jgi:hypothetical protein
MVSKPIIEPRRTGVSFYNTTRDIIKGLGGQGTDAKPSERVGGAEACLQPRFVPISPPRSAAAPAAPATPALVRRYEVCNQPESVRLFTIHLSRLRPSCSTTSESEALHAELCQLSTGPLSLPRKPFRQPASSHTPRPPQVSSFAQGASACANHLALAAGMTLPQLCYTNRERMRKSTLLRRSPAAPE